jgi:hypothetical protein
VIYLPCLQRSACGVALHTGGPGRCEHAVVAASRGQQRSLHLTFASRAAVDYYSGL